MQVGLGSSGRASLAVLASRYGVKKSTVSYTKRGFAAAIVLRQSAWKRKFQLASGGSLAIVDKLKFDEADQKVTTNVRPHTSRMISRIFVHGILKLVEPMND